MTSCRLAAADWMSPVLVDVGDGWFQPLFFFILRITTQPDWLDQRPLYCSGIWAVKKNSQYNLYNHHADNAQPNGTVWFNTKMRTQVRKFHLVAVSKEERERERGKRLISEQQ